MNLESEAKDLTFDEAMKATTDKWNESLRRILVSGGTEDSKIKFYTGLYHALLGRGLASDVNGAYPKKRVLAHSCQILISKSIGRITL